MFRLSLSARITTASLHRVVYDAVPEAKAVNIALARAALREDALVAALDRMDSEAEEVKRRVNEQEVHIAGLVSDEGRHQIDRWRHTRKLNLTCTAVPGDI